MKDQWLKGNNNRMNGEVIERLKNIEKMLRMLLAKETVDLDQMPIEPQSQQTPPQSSPTPPRWKYNEYMKPDDIAKEIGVDGSTVRRWLRDGEMPYTKFGKAVRIKTKDFEKYIKDNYIS